MRDGFRRTVQHQRRDGAHRARRFGGRVTVTNKADGRLIRGFSRANAIGMALSPASPSRSPRGPRGRPDDSVLLFS
jgi:hypothetical protein